jgi:hypothetical protein
VWRETLDGASLAVLRTTVGLLVAASVVRMWWLGWLDSLVIAPTHHLFYPALEVPVLPAAGVKVLAVLAIAAGVVFATGRCTRIAGPAVVVCFGWIEAMEATTYLNHYWLIFVLVVALTIVPTAPTRLDLGAIRLIVGSVYFFAGVAKLHADWLMAGLPLALWLPSRSHLPVIGGLLEFRETAVLLSWAGAAFDLAVGPLLAWRRTRRLAYAAVAIFHFSTATLLPSIGLFPLIMTISATVFFDPSWPRRFTRRPNRPPSVAGIRSLRSAVQVVWVAVVMLLPMRHWAIPGDARWTGEGYRFTWNVVAVEKAASLAFVVEGGIRPGLIDPLEFFTPYQTRIAAAEPDLIVQMAHVIGDELGATSVHADSWVSINGRPAARLIDPATDLLVVERSTLPPLIPPPDLGW